MVRNTDLARAWGCSDSAALQRARRFGATPPVTTLDAAALLTAQGLMDGFGFDAHAAGAVAKELSADAVRLATEDDAELYSVLRHDGAVEITQDRDAAMQAFADGHAVVPLSPLLRRGMRAVLDTMRVARTADAAVNP
jgi:hypothetical protein